ncbi:MAG: glycoside hydrolase family 3 protein [Spirochaetaceae bacterium]
MNFCTKTFTNHYGAGLRAATVTLLILFSAAVTAGCGASAVAESPPPGEPSGDPGPPSRRYVVPAPARYPAARDAHVASLVSEMSLEEKVAQLLVVALVSSETGGPLTELDPSTERRLRELQPGGVVLYGGNVEGVEQVAALISDVQATARIPLFVGIDEEGGLVSRLRHLGPGVATHLPPAATIGAAGDPLLSYRAGRALGAELRSLGFNLNFAPVVDVADPGGNAFLDSRTYSGDPQVVSRLATAFLRGLQTMGVSATVKHFPGHGGAVDDSHYGTAMVDAPAELLSRVDWQPFRAAVEAGADAIMVAHVAVPALTGDDTPASVSEDVLEGAARGELGFEGLLISDSVTMGGLSAALGDRSAAVAVVSAGGDIVLTPARPERARDEVLEAVRDGRVAESRIDASVRRILRVKLDRGILVPEEEAFTRRFANLQELDPGDVLAAAAHRELVEEIRRRAAANTGAGAAAPAAAEGARR